MIPRLLLVNGPPASGKTTLAPVLAQRLKLCLFCKDQLKELLFDTLGWGEREWSRKLGAACSELLFSIAESQLRAGLSCMLESNFHAASALRHLARLRQHYSFEVIQIICTADPAILIQRYNQRSSSGERHPGHGDEVVLPGLASAYSEPWIAIPYPGLQVHVDTSYPESIDLEKIIAMLAG